MKHLAFCFDGTWNKLDSQYPTNVARIAQSISHTTRPKAGGGEPIRQIIYFDNGVGTEWWTRFLGGAFGLGLTENIVDAYHALVLNYEPGDKIFVFGFSRGAFTARSFVGLIRNCGIMSRRSLPSIADAVSAYRSRGLTAHPNDEAMRTFRLQHCPALCLPGDREWRAEAHPGQTPNDAVDLKIDYLGVWDTVGALGIPKSLDLLFLNRQFAFHDTNLSSMVRRARHAVSADERRRTFEPSLWTNLDDLNAPDPAHPRYEQLIFPGTHGGVGGGGPIRGLSDGGLEWILRGAIEEGLELDMDRDSPIFTMRPDHRAPLFNETGKFRWNMHDRLMGAGLRNRRFTALDMLSIHESTQWRYCAPADELAEHAPYRPRSIEKLWAALDTACRAVGARVEYKTDVDPRCNQMPVRVRKYVVQPGDTLGTIARDQMGDVKDYKLLFAHNRDANILFDQNKVYAGTTIEIPEYAPPPAPQAAPAQPAPADVTPPPPAPGTSP